MIEELKSLVGTFWQNTYPSDFLSALLSARTALEAQTVEDSRNIALCNNIATTPVVRKVKVHPLILNLEERQYVLGFPVFDIPRELISAKKIVNGIIKYDTELHDTDYLISDGRIHIKEDVSLTPFTDKDGKLILWLHDAEFNVEYLYKYYGCVFGVKEKNSEAYRNKLKLLFLLLNK